MAEDDLNEAPTEVTGETVTDKDTPPVKKKAVRKKTPQTKAAAKKKVSVKKKAAPKKKAARKSRTAAGVEKVTDKPSVITEPQTPAPVVVSEQETAPGAVAKIASPSVNSVTEASATNDVADQISAKTTEMAAEPTAAVSPSVEKPQKEAPARNENVQKRLEEMGLMSSDAAEKQTPPPAKKSATSLGFWQKSFIWTIVIVAGLLYIRTATNDGDIIGDKTVMPDAEMTKTEQVATADASSPEVPQTEIPVTAVDQPNATDVAMAEATKDDSDFTPLDKASSDNAPAIMTSIATEESAVPESRDNKPTEESGPISTSNPAKEDQHAATTSDPSTALVSQPADGNTGQTSGAEGSKQQQPVVTTGTADSEAGPQTVETAVGAENSDTLAGLAGSDNQEPPTSMDGPMGNPAQLPGMASRYGRTGIAPMWANPQQPMPNRFGTTQSPVPAHAVPDVAQDPAENSANNTPPAPVTLGGRYPLPYQRGFIVPGYPRGFNNPPVAPYYWPYPPRPPVYGPAVRYPYHYPQTPR